MRASRPVSKCALCAAIVVVLAATNKGRAEAQTLASPKRYLATFTGDIWSAWISPARFDHRDVVPLVLTAGAFAFGTRVDSITRVWMLTHENTAVMRMLSPIREGSPIHAYELGSGQYLLPLSGALYLSGRPVTLRESSRRWTRLRRGAPGEPRNPQRDVSTRRARATASHAPSTERRRAGIERLALALVL
jgi:hypothetical protein